MTTSSSSWIRALAIGAFLWSFTPASAFAQAAHSEPSAADVESARALYVEGLELRDRGDLKMSLVRFQAAHALVATPITTLELGRALALSGQLLEARDVLLGVDRLPVRPDESQKASNARLEARTLAEQLRARIPSLTMRFVAKPDGAMRVTVDGVAVPPEALEAPRKLNPGKHVVFAQIDAARARTEVTLAEGESKEAIVSFAASDRAAMAMDERDRPAPTRAPPGPLFWTGGALAVGGFTVGSVAGIIAVSKNSTLSDVCAGTRCPRTAADEVSTAKTMAAVSTVGFAVAGVGALVAAVAWFTRDEKPSASPPVGAGFSSWQ